MSRFDARLAQHFPDLTGQTTTALLGSLAHEGVMDPRFIAKCMRENRMDEVFAIARQTTKAQHLKGLLMLETNHGR